MLVNPELLPQSISANNYIHTHTHSTLLKLRLRSHCEHLVGIKVIWTVAGRFWVCSGMCIETTETLVVMGSNR